MPKLSIIVPVYNAERYLKQCLTSIQNQSFSDYECLLIDDGSTDSSGVICDSFVVSNNKFKVRHIKNNGVSAARNLGLSIATGEFVTFVDSDDFIHKNTYSEVFKSFSENNSAEICCFNLCYYYNENKTVSYTFHNKTEKKNFISYPVYMNSVCNKVIKKDLFIKNQIQFNTTITVSEDLLAVFKLIVLSNKTIYLNECFYYYRVHPDSTINSPLSQKKINDTFYVSQELFNFCKEKNIYKYYKRTLYYFNAVSNLPLINKKDFFSPSQFRKQLFKFNLWTYSFHPGLFLSYFFASLYLDKLCYLLIKLNLFLKNRKKV